MLRIAVQSCPLAHRCALLLPRQVEIFTGRPHQIRIHTAAMGHPLVGDPLYGVGGVPKVRRIVGCGRCRGQHMRTWGHVSNDGSNRTTVAELSADMHACWQASYGRQRITYVVLSEDQYVHPVLWAPTKRHVGPCRRAWTWQRRWRLRTGRLYLRGLQQQGRRARSARGPTQDGQVRTDQTYRNPSIQLLDEYGAPAPAMAAAGGVDAMERGAAHAGRPGAEQAQAHQSASGSVHTHCSLTIWLTNQATQNACRDMQSYAFCRIIRHAPANSPDHRSRLLPPSCCG